MRSFHYRLAFAVLAGGIGLGTGAAMAQEAAADRPNASAMRVANAPALDGDVLGDAVWQQAPVIGGFTQFQPSEGAAATERTEVRMIYTRDTLYVGVIAYDSEPGGIVVADARRDSALDNTDSFQMIFDTFGDHQNAFLFGTSPAGLEFDGQITNEGRGGGMMGGSQVAQSGSGGGFNLNWDGAWEVRTRTTDIGWMAEFAIPFKTLRYPQGSNQAWGVNFQRNIRRKNEQVYWAPIPRQFNLHRVSLAGSVGGIDPPVFRNFKVTPYVLGEMKKSGQDPARSTERGELGFDAKYNLTPSLTLDATYNTDFAQVEVDDQQVNLDRFNLFFPEKRPFFLENAGLFSVGNAGEVDLFFSRRIGIASNGAPIPIIGGARVSGKMGQWNIGALDMQTEKSGTVTPSNNFGVMRVSRELPNRSAIGGIFVNRQGSGNNSGSSDYNRTYAVDAKWGIGQNTMLSGFLAKTSTPGIESGDTAFNIRSLITQPSWDLDVSYQEVGEGFNPEVGFLSRRGYRKPNVFLMTRFRPKNFLNLQEVRPHVNWRGYWGMDGFQESGTIHLDSHWQFKNSWEVHTGTNITREGLREPFQIFPGITVPAGTYDNTEAQLVVMTNQGKPVSFELFSTSGGFLSGRRLSLSPTLRLRAAEKFTTDLSYSYNKVDLPQGNFDTNLVKARVSYSFNTRLFTQALVQYNDRADLWSMNFRMGWLQSANTGLFIVYSDTRGLYDLFPNAPRRTDRSLTLKYSRMFDVLQ